MGLGILPPPGVAPPKPPDVQDFTSSGTWTKPDGARLVLAEIIGAGGGAQTSLANPGAGGEYVRMLFTALDLGATESVTIGAGGTGVASGTPGNGGSTTFASLTALGGDAGANNVARWTPNSGYKMSFLASGGVVRPSGNSYPYLISMISPATTPVKLPSSMFMGGMASDTGDGGDSAFGGGGGNGGLGGTKASMYGALKAGNGGTASAAATAPGGGGAANASYSNGARGQVRITTYF